MATARDVITTAMKLLGVLSSGESPTAAEADDGLTVLNQMLYAWADQGIDVEHSALELSDDLPYQDNHLQAMTYSLALEISPMFGVNPTPIVVAKQDEYFKGMQAFYADPYLLGCDPELNPYYNANRV